jgi:hypothetical protein
MPRRARRGARFRLKRSSASFGSFRRSTPYCDMEKGALTIAESDEVYIYIY